MVERTRLLAGIPLSKVDEVLQGLDCLMPGAQSLFDFFHQNNIVTIVASGSMMPILQHYQRLLGIDYLVGTTPTIRDGVIVSMTDEDAPRDGFKLAGVTSLLDRLGISFDQAIAIGDSPADRDLLIHAAVAIAINPVGGVEEVADHVLINDLSPAIGILEARPDRLKRLYSLIAEPYTKRYADDRSDAPIIDTFAASLRPGARVLDLGCGPGTFTSYLDQLDFDAVGVDLSPEMLRHALHSKRWT
jgi:phosphoserine phosphatase